MKSRTSQLAQSAAEGLSRRRFMGRLGRTSAVAAAAIGGILMVPREARAGKFCLPDADCPKGHFCYWAVCRSRKRKGPWNS